MVTRIVDRVPQDPGRVYIMPENPEREGFYATVTRADNPKVNGTPLDAATLNGMADEIQADIAAANTRISSLGTTVTNLSNRQNISMSVSGDTLYITF